MAKSQELAVVSYLPDAHDTRHSVHEPGSTLWLELIGRFTVVPGLVQKQNAEHDEEELHGDPKPQDGTPIEEAGEHEVPEQRSKVWRRNEQCGPQSNLPSAFMKEEDVADEGNGNAWWCVREDALHHTCDIVCLPARGQGNGQVEKGRNQRSPENRRSSSPPCGHGHEKQGADSAKIIVSHATNWPLQEKHDSQKQDVERISMIDSVGVHLPPNTLDDNQRRAAS